MIISELLEGLRIKKRYGPLNTVIKGIAYDSRSVKKDFLFVAIRGFSVDGHNYIKDAVSRGATALIAEDAVEKTRARENKTTYIEVPDSRKALALISAAFYGHPSKSLSMIGVTGTNGKSTTGFITKDIINAGDKDAGLIGTICYMIGDRTVVAANTTPESLELQGYLREMVNNKIEYAVVEVSSHALALKRVEGCSFNVAAFTNFSQDHLDFHGTMDDYFGAKCKLFTFLDAEGTAVLNWDDPMIRQLADKLNCNVITCGTEGGAMLKAENITDFRFQNHKKNQKHETRNTENGTPNGLSFEVQTPENRYIVESGLMGRFNAYNILMSIGIAHALGISAETIQKGIRDAMPVEGRFESIEEGQNFLCIVDYAHTEDALKKLIGEVKSITRKRIITVFGCGGDRDKTKRPLMGAAASELSDLVVITSDNPRSEEPSEIIRDIIQGIKKNNFTIQPDREEAIKEAISMVKEGDTLLVAGKGHEVYQEIKGMKHHFSDKEVLRKAIEKIKN